MADPRTFTLIGEFKDGITPELEKINKQLATLKSSLSGVGSRKNTGFRGATNDIGKLVSAHKNLTSSIKEVDNALRSTLGTLKQYRSEMGKAASATRAFQKAGGNLGGGRFKRDMDAANKSAQAYLRTLQQINTQSRRMPRGGMGGGFQPPRPPRGGGGGGGMNPPSTGHRGGAGAGPGGFHMAEFGFAYTLGSALANPIQNAIVSGFQIGVGLMTKPFEYFAGAFGERVKDQLSDLQAAGGLLSISKRSKTPFLQTMDEAIQFQQDTNKVFANMAKDLPGVTNDYVQVGKRLGDTMARITSGDFQNALQEANRIRGTEEGRKYYGAAITGTGAQAQRDVMTTLLGEMTKKTTLAGLGGSTGAGGIAGAYGLPGLTERMLSQQEVSMGQFQRYAAVFSNPTVSDALARNVDLVNKTMPNTAARFKAMQKLLDEIVTPELIDALRTSVDGVYQGLRSTIFDPDTGLFGLGRQFKDFGYAIDQYGRYQLDKAGNKIKQDLSIFEIIANIFSNVGQVLLPIAEILPLVFDPLKKVANILMDARHYTAEFARTFNEYREGLKILSQQKDKQFLKGSIDARAAMGAINNLLLQFKVIGQGDFESIAAQLGSKDLNFGEMLKMMIDKVLNSDIAKNIGETIGEIVGTVLSEVAGVTGFISGRIASSNKLFDGLKAGFEKAGGPEAFTNIFKDLFSSVGKVLLGIAKMIPLQAYVLAAAMLVLPAAVQGLAMAIASGLSGALFGLTNKMGPLSQKMMTRAAATQGLGHRGKAFGAYQGSPQRYGRGGSIDRLNRMRRYKMGQTAQFAGEAVDLGYSAMGRPGAKAFGGFGKGAGKFGKGVGRMARAVPGGALAAGAIDMGLALASGENFGKAAAGSIGTVLGGAVGTVFGPAGTLIGSIAGGMIGDAVAGLFDSTSKASVDQLYAANMQTYAAKLQDQAAKLQAGGLAPEKAQYAFGTGEQFTKRLEALGLATDKNVIALNAAYQARERDATAAKQAADELNKKITILREAKVPSDLIAQQVRPLQEASDRATASLVRSQSNFDRVFRGLAPLIQNKITASISNLSFKNVETIVANKFANLEFKPPQFAGLTLGQIGIRDQQQDFGFDFGDKPPKYPDNPGLSSFDGMFDPKKPKRYKGGLGDAISEEIKHKPAGSKLVIANSSETIIPKSGIISAATGHIPKFSKMSGALAQVKYGGGKPPGGGSANWMQILEADYQRNKNKPIPGGPTRNSGRGGLDMWEGPGSAYLSPSGMYRQGGSSMAAAPINVTSPITINTQPGQNADEIASIVAMKIGDAVAQARASSVFV